MKQALSDLVKPWPVVLQWTTTLLLLSAAASWADPSADPMNSNTEAGLGPSCGRGECHNQGSKGLFRDAQKLLEAAAKEEIKSPPPAKRKEPTQPKADEKVKARVDFAAPTSAKSQPCTIQRGEASVYADKFQGRRTASGEPFDMGQRTAAHRYLDLATPVVVTNLDNGKKTVVRVNDRGPFAKATLPQFNGKQRVIDLSGAAASAIGISGLGAVEIVPVGCEQLAENN